MQDGAKTTVALDRAQVEAVLHEMLDGLAESDAGKVVRYFATDVVYSGGTANPYDAPRVGKEACVELVRAVIIAYECLGSTVHELLIDGDRAAVRRTTRLRNRGSGRFFDISICNFVRFRDGQIVEFSQYPDTLAFARLNSDR